MKSIILAGLLLGMAHGTAVEAHPRHKHNHVRQSVVVTQWGFHWVAQRPPKVRLNRNCVWKPWNNRTVCKY